MTTRLYYTDQTLRTFDAVVRLCDPVEGRLYVRLDRSAFYPSSGGQPHDQGRIGDAHVVDVFEHDDGDVVHVVDRPLEPGATMRAEIDWPRRFDHMQQHTGQHVLSAAFDRVVHVRTASVHLGATGATIDLTREVTAAECASVELAANQVIWEDRPVHVRFATPEEAATLPLRKEPVRTGLLRLIEVEEFDLSACGGTHVARTGMIGEIAVTQTERYKGATRVTFACGGRALLSHRRLRDIALAATRTLSVPPEDLAAAIERTQSETKEAARRLRALQGEVARYRAAELRQTAESVGRYRVVLVDASDLEPGAMKDLASAVVSEAGLIAAVAGRGTPTPVVVACGAGVAINAGMLLKDVLVACGGRGGGTPSLAQGGVGVDASTFLAEVRRWLQASASQPES